MCNAATIKIENERDRAIWSEIEPDKLQDVTVDGYTVKTYSFGNGDNVMFCANGGPGLPCD